MIENAEKERRRALLIDRDSISPAAAKQLGLGCSWAYVFDEAEDRWLPMRARVAPYSQLSEA